MADDSNTNSTASKDSVQTEEKVGTVPARPFRFNAKTLFATYPHCDVEPSVVLGRILDRWTSANIDYCVVSSETHSDGSPHIHLLVQFKSKQDIRNVRILDDLGGKHGNYQAVRKILSTIDYIKKGGVWIENGIPPSTTTSVTEQIAKRIREGGSLEEVEEEHPGYFLLHQRNIVQYANFVNIKRSRQLVKRPPLVIYFCGCEVELGFSREFKQKQFFFFGPPNTGKTSFVLDLINDGFRAFQIPYNNDFAGYDDDMYDFAYCDEFKGQLTITFLNEWLQGSPLKLNVKCGQAYKKKNLPTFILSNFSLEECFPNSGIKINTLECRLHIVFTGINK